ncbi:MAG: O-antigen ligase family protein [Candidatus Dojkabacteria bacterium]
MKENAGNTAIKCFLLIITVICLCLITSSLWQLFHNPSSILKISGSFYNPARNANYLISLIPFLLCGVISPKVLKLSKRFCIIMLITAVLSGFILILAYTRAAWIGLLFSLYFILLIHYRISILKRKGLFLIIIIIGMCVGGISIYKLKPQSALGRITIWKISLQMIKDNPVIGVGYGNFHKKYNLYQGNYFGTGKFTKDEVERADTVRYAYNEILHSISELGIFGLFLNCCLVYLILKTYVETFKSNNNTLCFLSNAVLASFIAITVSGFFSYPFDILPVKIVCFLYLGLYSTTIEEKKSLAISNTLPYFISAILTIYGGYLTVDAILKYNAYKDYKNANNANSMEAIYPILIEDTDFIEKYSDLLLREYNYKAVILLLRDRNDLIYPSMLVNLGIAYEASSDYIKAEYCYIKAVNMIPNRFYSKYILATFYLQNGQIEKGMKISTEILTTKPKIPSKSVEKIKSEIKRLIETQSINKNK